MKFDSSLNQFQNVLENKNNLPNFRSELFLYLDTRTKLPETLLNYTDKITMHFALECRVPMLDNDLVAFIESLPRDYRYTFRHSKIIHKEFAREYLPDEIINRKKLAFHSPSKSYFIDHAPMVKEWILQNKNEFFWNVFDKEHVIHMIDEHAQYGNNEKELILIISALFLTSN
jgi:asparagine synthase (glutamine-hydrolysing)